MQGRRRNYGVLTGPWTTSVVTMPIAPLCQPPQFAANAKPRKFRG